MPQPNLSTSPNATTHEEEPLPIIGVRRGQPRSPLEFARDEPERFAAVSAELDKLSVEEYNNRRYSFFQVP
ncbi:MAG: hypothetical protein WC551_03060 [Patescibacteria group bacterium]